MKIEEAVACKCVECKRGVAASVAACGDTACALYPYRNGAGREKRTMNLSGAERERRRERGRQMAAERWGKGEQATA